MTLEIGTIHLKARIENPVVFLINFPMNMPAITGSTAGFGVHFVASGPDDSIWPWFIASGGPVMSTAVEASSTLSISRTTWSNEPDTITAQIVLAGVDSEIALAIGVNEVINAEFVFSWVFGVDETLINKESVTELLGLKLGMLNWDNGRIWYRLKHDFLGKNSKIKPKW